MKQFSRVLTSTKKTLFMALTLVMPSVLAILLAIPTVSFAQITTATIVGTVTDPGGASVPNASITARNADTGLTRTVVSRLVTTSSRLPLHPDSRGPFGTVSCCGSPISPASTSLSR
jgi:hypothetical protein